MISVTFVSLNDCVCVNGSKDYHVVFCDVCVSGTHCVCVCGGVCGVCCVCMQASKKDILQSFLATYQIDWTLAFS